MSEAGALLPPLLPLPAPACCPWIAVMSAASCASVIVCGPTSEIVVPATVALAWLGAVVLMTLRTPPIVGVWYFTQAPDQGDRVEPSSAREVPALGVAP